MTGPHSHNSPEDPSLQSLLEGREVFVRFLAARLGNRPEAEDLVQASLLKVLQTSARPDASESAVAWFYQVLRNALTDHFRARQAEGRATERHARDQETAEELELERVACQCIQALLPTLKPAEAQALSAVDLGGQSPAEAAARLGLSPNAMSVRLHRARKALREKVERTCRTCAEHGCQDCRCRATGAAQKNR